MFTDDQEQPLPPVSEDFVIIAHLRNDGSLELACDTKAEIYKAGTEVTAHLGTPDNQRTINFILEDIGLGIVRGEQIIPSFEAKEITRIKLDLPPMMKTHTPQIWSAPSLTLLPPVRAEQTVKCFSSLLNCDA